MCEKVRLRRVRQEGGSSDVGQGCRAGGCMAAVTVQSLRQDRVQGLRKSRGASRSSLARFPELEAIELQVVREEPELCDACGPAGGGEGEDFRPVTFEQTPSVPLRRSTLHSSTLHDPTRRRPHAEPTQLCVVAAINCECPQHELLVAHVAGPPHLSRPHFTPSQRSHLVPRQR